MAPCGEVDINVTSAADISGGPLDMLLVKKTFVEGLIGDVYRWYGENAGQFHREAGVSVHG